MTDMRKEQNLFPPVPLCPAVFYPSQVLKMPAMKLFAVAKSWILSRDTLKTNAGLD